MRRLRPGVYRDLKWGVYLSDAALSASDTIAFLGSSPHKFHASRPKKSKRTPALEFGRIAHRLIIEELAVAAGIDRDGYKVQVRGTYQTNAPWITVRAGEDRVSTGWMRNIEEMREALWSDEEAMTPLRQAGGCPEVTLVWDDEEFGIRCRARLDWMPDPGYRYFVDYKTARSIQADEISAAIARYSYHLRAAHYIDAIKRCGLCDDPVFLLLMQEKEFPYESRLVQIPDEDLKWGHIEMMKARAEYARCLHSGIWPKADQDVSEIGLPPWARRRLEHRHEAGEFAFERWTRAQAPLNGQPAKGEGDR